MSGRDQIVELARAAKRANMASGVEPIADDLLIRAATAWRIMECSVKHLGERLPLTPQARTLCILHIASNFDDATPSTLERASLFATVLDVEGGPA